MYFLICITNKSAAQMTKRPSMYVNGPTWSSPLKCSKAKIKLFIIFKLIIYYNRRPYLQELGLDSNR